MSCGMALSLLLVAQSAPGPDPPFLSLLVTEHEEPPEQY